MTTLAEAIDALSFDLGNATYPVNDPINGDSNAASPWIFDYQYETSQPGDMTDPGQQYTGWTALTTSEKTAYNNVLAYIETLINVDFQEVTGQADPTMHVGKVDLTAPTAGEGGFSYSFTATNPSTIVDWDNFTVFRNDISLDTNQDGLMLHEIGHALGLKHPFSGSPTLPAELENNKYTVMSYTANPDNGLDSDGYQIYDIAALQARWGANLSTATGNDTYTGRRNTTVDVVWDAGGTDTFDASAKTTGVVLSLKEGTFSRFGTYDDVAVAFGVTIENATGGSGGDIITGNDVANVLTGNNGNDYLRGEGGTDTLLGGFGADYLRGGAGADVLNGGAGSDWADYSTAPDAVTVNLANSGLNTGTDAAGDTYVFVERVLGSTKNDTITGDGNVNYLRGWTGDDMIFGGGGNDFLQGDAGADALDGGSGSDWAYYTSSSEGVVVNLANSALNSGGTAAGDTYTSIENVYGSNHSDTLTGDANGNFLRGGAGVDTLNGGDGADYLRGNEGADILNGGSGADWAYYATSGAAVTVNLANDNLNAGGEAAGDQFSSIERVFGSAHNDHITGDGGVNYLRGFSGADTIIGGGGNDYLQGDLGGDTLDGGTGSDWAYYASAGSAVSVNLGNAALNTGSDAVGDSYTSIENIVGSRYNDTIRGDDANNYLRGYLGDDTIIGGLGDDTLRGESGNDTFQFVNAAFGDDQITDFTDGSDMLDFTAVGFTYASFTKSQAGSNTLLTLTADPSQTLTLLGVNQSLISGDDFV